MEVDGACHSDEQRQGGRACEEAHCEQQTTPVFGIIVDGRPQRGLARQEAKVRFHDEINEAFKARCAIVGRPETALRTVVNHQDASEHSERDQWYGVNALDLRDSLKKFRAREPV
eukprot:CAMPEP_0174738556 /NCGR_PEP_ID=MMETSP1094-20130205/70156_1 /TAXON_ID=156173 /ORGANISM="Chrysochromulina brevifilum, Strain UTEX LB 985" /LENGTH=114 /DNA_ID=CAMNT_0015941993 /DNA_START=381 /DNA_END=725 /DNA_ORIENTATION=-